jgi:hypothetical protein
MLPLFTESDFWGYVWHTTGKLGDQIKAVCHTDNRTNKSRGMIMFIGPEVTDEAVMDMARSLLETRKQESQHS